MTPTPAPAEPLTDERLRRALRCAALGVSTADSGDVFDELARHIAAGLGVEFAFVAELAPDATDCVHVITAWIDGEFRRDFTYELAGTPCANVIGQVYRFYQNDARNLFADTMLVDLGVEGYAAVPLFDSTGTALGLMAVMSRTPLGHPELTEWMLRIFSVRAANELEKLRARQAIREKTEQYQAIFNSALDGLLLFDEHGRPVEANAAFKAMHGYPEDADFSGVPPERFIPADYLPVYQNFIDDVRTKGHCELKGRGLRRDGGIIDLDVRGVRMYFQGKPRLLAMVRDITEAKRREDALRKSEDRLRATVEAALDPIVSMDSRGRIIEFNPAAEACFGHTREQAIGRSLGNLIVPERHRRAHHAGLERYLREGRGPYLGKRVELSALHANGTEFPIELAISVAEGEEGQIFIGYLRDITQRQRAERERATLESQLRQAQKMEAIGHMSGGIAHDFNNILTTVLGYIVMAQERCTGAGDERVARYLDRAHLSGQRAQELIAQLLTFSRGQRGAPRPLALASLVKEAVRLLGATLPSSIEFGTRLDEDAPRVQADPVQMEQILMNLCLNARDAMGGQGQLTVAVDDVNAHGLVCTSCRRAVDGHFVELVVTDTGPGVPIEIQDRMFEPFFTTKEVGKGSGMGLATVHGIVHEHGGHVVLESSPGEGARFRVLLPALEHDTGTEDSGRPATGGTGAQGRRLDGRVLLVDDEFAVCDFMADLLDSWGLQVVAETDSRAARERFDADPRAFDLLVTDQTMPGLTGLELAAAALTRRPGLPVVLYTGYSEQVDEGVARAAGIAAFMTKPVDVDGLYRRLKELLAPGRDTRK